MDRTVLGLSGSAPRLEHTGGERSRVESPRGWDADDPAELRKLADQLQGVFIQQLFKAMRDTVPENGSAFGRAGSEMFSGIMDEHLAEAASVQLQKGLGQAIYRQLSGLADEQAGGQASGQASVKAGGQAEMKSDPGTVGGAGEDLT